MCEHVARRPTNLDGKVDVTAWATSPVRRGTTVGAIGCKAIRIAGPWTSPTWETWTSKLRARSACCAARDYGTTKFIDSDDANDGHSIRR